MSEVAKWYPTDAALIVAGADVAYITYADHARIVAEIEGQNWSVVHYRKGYEQGKADAEQAHAAALAEVPDFSPQRDDESDHEYLSRSIGRCAVTFDPKRGQNAAAPRTLTADDPEPAVGSVVLDPDGDAWQRTRSDKGWVRIGYADRFRWDDMSYASVTLIHDGEATPQHVGPCSGMGGPFGCDCNEGAAIDGEATT